MKVKTSSIIIILLYLRYIFEFITFVILRDTINLNIVWNVIDGSFMILSITYFILVRGEKIKYNQLVILYLFYLIWIAFRSNLANLKPIVAETTKFLFLYFSMILCEKENYFEFFNKWILLLIKINILFAVLQFVLLDPKSITDIFTTRGIRGIFSHSNVFSLIIGCFFVYFLEKKKFGWITLTGIVLLLAGSRFILVVFLIHIVILIRMFFNKKITKMNILGSFMVYVVFYIIMFFIYGVQAQYTGGIDRFSLDSVIWRTWLWKEIINKGSLTVLKITFGSGIGTIYEIIAGIYREVYGIDSFVEAHNDYLKLLLDTGLFGILLFISIHLKILVTLYKHYFESKNKFIIMVPIIILLTLATDNVVFNTNIIVLYSLLGCYLGCANGEITKKVKGEAI
ncbi:MAG: hypothetical protein JG776_2421 [Caloramator sp.]|jgi:O-antigen ligase|uniref:O-antigen ligase family protein n=1 Tax=Caloramator sp. TaxID=1871330 RepID=UPI001D425561|nr:O-antigen ligase family protein [Caloramator sp.]MBZ4664697.1 hypothetical protein [Caloramator sp.]